jgi:Cellulose biosynthesis protein BcsS
VCLLRWVIATVFAVASGICCAVTDRALAAPPDDATFLFFGGTDLWRYGDFLYGGAIWAPAGVDNSGFTLKGLISSGWYKYTSGALNADIKGTMMSAAILPGWKFVSGKLIVSLYVGPVVQDYRLSPNDPGARLHGLYLGGQFAADIWYEPTSFSMISVNGALASIGPTGSLRVALGTRLLDLMFIGPETEEIWCGNFEEYQFGLHITALRTDKLEWSAASGIAFTSDHRDGPYFRIGVNTKY